MYPFTQIPLTANGNVRPGRCLTFVSGTGNVQLAVEATGVTTPIVGISEAWTRFPPGSPSDDGFIAIAGEQLPYRGPMQIANAVAGAAIANGHVPLTSDGSGRVIESSLVDGTEKWFVGFAMGEASAAGDLVPVYVMPMWGSK